MTAPSQIMKLFWILPVILTVCCSVRIQENGYKAITLSFSEESLEGPFDFEKLKDVMKKASELLYHATRRRSYFEEFIFVLPSTWSDDEEICDGNAREVPKNVDIYVTDDSSTTLTAQHSRGCGQQGEIIYLPKDWLIGDTEDLALQFVQQWSVFRYGVFSENPERFGSCVATGDSKWSPAGCYNIDLDTKVIFNEDGLPLCDFPDGFSEREQLHSSIMFSANSSKVVDFCDGSESFPHNPVGPTLHNRICEGKTVWSVIVNTEDFLYGRNLPLNGVKPPKNPIFRCFKETKTHLSLAVQDTDSEARAEIRYALFHFLSVIESTDFSVSLTTFSSDSLTEAANSVDLDLRNKDEVKSLLDLHVKLNEKVPNVCLTCGLRKAYEVSASSPHPLRVIILLARESSLKDTRTSELIEIVQSEKNVAPYLLFLEDTISDIIPPSLVDAVQDSGGRIFRVKNDAVFMLTELNVALLDASKNVLHLEDKVLVVHKEVYMNVKSDITDVFVTPAETEGKLLYSMQCKRRGEIRNKDTTCTDQDRDLQSPICGSEVDITDEDSAKIWRYTFQYIGGSEGTTCSSLALLKLQSRSTFSLKGWLSSNRITPGRNALIIYAGIFGNSTERNFQVEALISGPGLEEFRLELRDNGNGDPDIIKGDHIYSRYFTSFEQKGTYKVSILAKALVAGWNETIGSEENSEENGISTSQMKVIGTFRIMQSPPTEDIYPPNQVSDLKIISINNTNRKILLQWTAPGNNYDHGNATKYTIKLSNNWMSLMDFTFHLKENVLLETDEYKPAISGITENVTVQCPLSNSNETYYIALQAMDEKNNIGRTSNIIQVHFKDAYFPTNDSLDISTETPSDSNETITDHLTTLVSTEVSISNFTSPGSKNTSDENKLIIPTNETKDGIFIEKRIFIISTATVGAFVLILIITNIITCCCCCFKKKHPETPKKISREASLRPPYNINMAYKYGSETSLEEENAVGNSISTLMNPNNMYSNSDGSAQEKRYAYHTNRSLKNKMDSHSRKNDLGFKLVQPMPAYATSSLSRFAARHMNTDDESEISTTRNNVMQFQKLTDDMEVAQMYALGEV